MAKTIVRAEVKTSSVRAVTTNTVMVTIECPPSEYAALIVLAGLTNAVPAAITTRINAITDTGATQ